MSTPPTPPPDTSVLLDQLVPPPWSPRRRLAGLTVGVIIAAVVGALWWTGVLGPNIGPVRGYGYGALDDTVGTTEGGASRGVVELQLELHNRGRLAVEDLTLGASGFAGGELTQPGGPIDLAAGERRPVTLNLAIADCSRFQAPPETALEYDASSTVVDAHGRSLRLLGAGASGISPSWPDAHDPEATRWWYEIAQPVCDPEALHAP